VADGVYAHMQEVQSTPCQPPLDGAPAETSVQELGTRNHAMLAMRQPSYRMIQRTVP
jgi:hypothetical protein